MRSAIHASLAALALAVPVAARAQETPASLPAGQAAGGTMLTVTAEGRVARTPDLATVRAGVVTQAPAAADALAANAGAMARALAALRKAGIAERDLSTAAVSLQPQMRYADGQPPAITGYQATNSVTVRMRDVAGAGRVLDTLVAAGINQIEGPTLAIAEPDAALDAARGDAVRRARARADLYARAAGLRVDRIVSMSETGEDAGATPPPVLYRMRAEAAAVPTRILAGETDVTAALTVRFLLR